MRRIKMVLAYDGTNFSGWQYQPETRTVQSTLEEAVEAVVQHPLRVVAAGRTDAGVHALGQTVHFKTTSSHPVEVFKRAFNAHLPKSIRVRRVREAPRSFHARYSASSRLYRYFISPYALPFFHRYAWVIERPLDRRLLEEALVLFVGEHDFAAFGSPQKRGSSTVRRVLGAEAKTHRGLTVITIEANAFLKRMVRNLVGTAVRAAMGRTSLKEVRSALDHPQECCCPATPAPPQGLFLWRVKYGKREDEE
jgi:tRNA pseudouridine38-40 synthase